MSTVYVGCDTPRTGSWLAKCSTTLPDLPPAAARALLFGALWGCFVPLAALVALLLPLSVKPTKSLRNLWRSRLRKGFRKSNWSGHFVLVASYLKWKESQTKVSEDPNEDSNLEKAMDGLKDEEVKTSSPRSPQEATERTKPIDGFWEAVDQKVLTFCDFARTTLKYTGDDVEGSVSGTPWTVTALLSLGPPHQTLGYQFVY